MNFLALSQAPPALDMKIAKSTPVTSAPAKSPPRAAAPRAKPTATGTATARTPGRTICLSAAAVEIATQDS